MVAGWMLYVVLVSALLLGAGWLLEAAARRLGLPQRGVWAATMGASALLPLLARFRPAAPPAAAEEMAPGAIALLEPVTALAAEGSPRWAGLLAAAPPLDPLLLGLWGGASGALLLVGLFSAVRLRRAMCEWEEARGGGPRVLVSETTGPAVIGFFPGAIVLPRWAESGDPGVRRLMLSHEEEHLRAWDPALLLVATLVAVALPWNPALWWQLRRLRLAVEVDCDARVLGRGSDLRTYATLLMEVGRRRAGLDPALLAFAQPASFLERRIRLMTRDRRGSGWVAAGAMGAVAIALVVTACRMEQPTEQAQPEPTSTVVGEDMGADPIDDPRETPAIVEELGAAAAGGTGREVGPEQPARAMGAPRFDQNPATQLPAAPSGAAPSENRPQFSPRDVEPALRNRVEFGRALERAYPAVLKGAGVGGRVLLWVRLDETGAVTNVQLYESSGQPQLDQAAMQVMREVADFSPASNRGDNVAAWIALPVTFATTTTAAPRFAPREGRRMEDLPTELAGRAADLSQQPAFTPREKEPALQNRTEFAQTLERLYPSDLREAGVTGRALLWIFVDESGRVANARIYESSGNARLDEAAMEAIRTARFSPAENRGEAVPVWVALPVTFRPRAN